MTEAGGDDASRASRVDTITTSAAAAVFAFGSGVASLLLPLLAVESGVDVSTVGVFYATSSLIQVLLRPALIVALRHWSTRQLVGAGMVAQVCGLVTVLYVSNATLCLSWALQGVARSAFWTGIETHAATSGASGSRRVGVMHVYSGIGQLAGPAIGGLVAEAYLDASVWFGLGVALGGLPLSLLLAQRAPRLPEPHHSAARVWRQPGIGASLAAAGVAGVWRGLLDSVIPLLLRESGHSIATVGVAVAVSNGMAIPGAALVATARARYSTYILYLASTVGMAGAVGTVALFSRSAGLVFVVVTAGGLASGVLQTLAPALAAGSAVKRQIGEAIALQGMCRTLTMLAVPAAAAVLTVLVPLSISLFTAGMGIAVCGRLARSLPLRSPGVRDG